MAVNTTPQPRSRSSSKSITWSPQRPPPILDEASDRSPALEDSQPQVRQIVNGLGSKETHERVKVMAVRSLEPLPRKLDQVRGRGLLSHRRSSIPHAHRIGRPANARVDRPQPAPAPA